MFQRENAAQIVQRLKDGSEYDRRLLACRTTCRLENGRFHDDDAEQFAVMRERVSA